MAAKVMRNLGETDAGDPASAEAWVRPRKTGEAWHARLRASARPGGLVSGPETSVGSSYVCPWSLFVC